MSIPSLPRILIPFAFGYLISYIFRAVNAVIAPALTLELGVTADELGLLTAAYFLAFAGFQLPLGILLDRFGPRRVETLLLGIAAAGALLFALAHSLIALIVGRALIGIGVSACLMAAFKAYVLWSPPRRLPLVNGLQTAAGGVGALCATLPAQKVLAAWGWRPLFLGLAALTLLAALTIFYLIPDPVRPRHTGLHEQLAGLRSIFQDPFFWRITPWTVASQAAFLSLQGLWAGPWLRSVAGLDAEGTARVLFLTAGGMVCGFLTLGWLSSHLEHHGIAPLRVAVLGLTAFLAAQLGILLIGSRYPALSWPLFGFLGTSGILPYAILSRAFRADLAGRVNTALNVLVFLAAFAAQWGIGGILRLWPENGPGRYAPEGFHYALLLLLLLQLTGAGWYLLSRADSTKETPCT